MLERDDLGMRRRVDGRGKIYSFFCIERAERVGVLGSFLRHYININQRLHSQHHIRLKWLYKSQKQIAVAAIFLRSLSHKFN